MKPTSLNDLREAYLSFFEARGHLRLPSYSLIPDGDKSLLLINAGMAPLKKYFTGEATPPSRRVTTCQKCIRTLDIDNVGKTARHGTFFEMLGNFSFGDYFKKEAISWSWEFLTKTLEIPEALLYPSVYENDDEAFEIWNKTIGIPAERIIRMGREDNFWELGSGPCGPCSEIYFDRGEKHGCGSPDCAPGCDCDRFIEIWNNVFSQFSNDGAGNYSELKQKNIDTGMGLERLACVIQDVDNLFEVDTIRRILDRVCSLSGVKYGENAKADMSVRVITDHIRSSAMLISDGVLPSNEGRGYILRRLLRRASRHGKLIGIDGAFLAGLCDTVIAESEGAYPALREKEEYIKKIIANEEKSFSATVDAGLTMLNEIIDEATEKNSATLSGDSVFRLHDTYGFPVDLTREIASERGLAIDEDGFAALMNEQKKRARDARGGKTGWSDSAKTLYADMPKTKFCGYDAIDGTSEVTAIIANGEQVSSATCGVFSSVSVVLDRTPFYAEGGGQVGDTGTLTCKTCTLKVTDTKKTDGVFIHECELAEGEVVVGMTLSASVDGERRRAVCRNHSAAHLLQASLRRILGEHVSQAGSYVDDSRMRFDFSHFSAVTPDELRAVEQLVNEEILRSQTVSTVETDIESARRAGAVALFGEKYSSTVRMVKMGDFSCELCGGTHCKNTSEIGLFRIVSESSVAAGVRRIEAVTGLNILRLIDEKDELVSQCAKALKAGAAADLPAKIAQLNAEVSSLKHEIDSLNSKMARGRLDELVAAAEKVGSCDFIAKDLGEMSLDTARALCDELRVKCPSCAAVFAIRENAKMNLITACGSDAVKSGAHAGSMVKAASAVCNGRGGGRPDSACAGISDMSKITEAFAAAKATLA